MKTKLLAGAATVLLAFGFSASQAESERPGGLAGDRQNVQPTDHKACLRRDSIRNWSTPSDHAIVVEDDFHRNFLVTLMGKCIDLEDKEHIAFRSFGGRAMTCIVPGDSVLIRGATGRQECAIKYVELYTAEMEKADKAARH